MAKAAEPRPRRLSATFGGYFILVVLFAYYFSDRVTPYVDPSATRWMVSAYALLGALALAAICVGALRRSRRLEDRIEEFEAVIRRARAIHAAEIRAMRARRFQAGPRVVDSGSPDHEVAELLDGLQRITQAVAAGPDPHAADGNGYEPDPEGSVGDEHLRGNARQIRRLKDAQDHVAVTLTGPAMAAIAVVAVYAPLLPAADGMLLADLGFNATLWAAGMGWLLGVLAYSGLAFRQLSRRAAG